VQYRSFGKAGFRHQLSASAVCVFPTAWVEIDEALASKCLYYRIDNGVNYLDTLTLP